MPEGSKPGVCDDCRRYLHNVFHTAKEALSPVKKKVFRRRVKKTEG